MPNVSGPHLLPAEQYPLTITFHRVSNDEEVHRIVLEQPEGLAAVTIPPVAKMVGEPVYVVTTMADGQQSRSDPP